MLRKRSLTVSAVAFVVVLVGGVALAQVGTFDLSAGRGDDAPDVFTGDTFGVDEDDYSTLPTVDEPAKTEDEAPAVDKAEEPAQAKAEEPAEDKPEADTSPPEFGILFPVDGYHTDDEVQVFEGLVEQGASVTRGKYEAKVDGDGWRIELVLSPGKNVVTLVAMDAAGNKAKDTVTVYLEGKDEEPPKEEPGHIEFSANQKFGSCGEAVPYDVFYGTATPGATIYVASPYGGGTTMAGDKGGWDIMVKFPETPPGQVFEVVIESSDGGRKLFTFVNTGESHDGEPDK